jgi:hypothetical protein
MTYGQGRQILDADSHIMELPGWLEAVSRSIPSVGGSSSPPRPPERCRGGAWRRAQPSGRSPTGLRSCNLSTEDSGSCW